MTAQLSMLKLLISGDLDSAISSQGSVGSDLPAASPAGPTTGRYGQGDSHASLSLRQGGNSLRKMTVTSGRSCLALLSKSDPLYSLAKTLLASSTWHSMECSLTWRARATPAGRLLFQLVPKTLPIDVTGCGLPRSVWPTPQARDGFPPHSPDYMAEKRAQGHGMANLNDVVAEAALWPTPMERDHQRGVNPPRTQDTGVPLSQRVGQVLGLEPNTSTARTEKPGALAPEFVSWLMGYPTAWLECAPEPSKRSRSLPKESRIASTSSEPSATPSSLPSRRRSSKP